MKGWKRSMENTTLQIIDSNTENTQNLGLACHFEDLEKYGHFIPRPAEKEDGFFFLHSKDTVSVEGMMVFDRDLPYYNVNVKDTILVEKSKREALIRQLEKLEIENDKFRQLLGGRKNRLYSKKEKQLQHIFILADALEGKSNAEIQKSRGKKYSKSAISRVLAVNVRPDMAPDEYSACRGHDLARLRRIYNRDTSHTTLFMPFEDIEKWYDKRASAKLKHSNNPCSQVEQLENTK